MDPVDKQELMDRCKNDDVKPLDDMYDLEEIAYVIKDCTHKIDIQKAYKKKRNQSIADEIAKLQRKIDYYKKVIVSTLEKNKEKNLHFPDVVKLSLRKARAKWIVDDEEALLKALEDQNELENCATKIEGWKLVKKETDKVLNDWEKSETLPDSVHKELGETGVSLSFIYPEEEAEEAVDTTVPIKEEDYDDLEW